MIGNKRPMAKNNINDPAMRHFCDAVGVRVRNIKFVMMPNRRGKNDMLLFLGTTFSHQTICIQCQAHRYFPFAIAMGTEPPAATDTVRSAKLRSC